MAPVSLYRFSALGPAHIMAPGADVPGTPDDDVLSGSGGDDTMEGLQGYDSLFGLAGDDTIDGGADDDTLVGGLGADHLVGGDGFDTASYEDASAGVVASLADPSLNTGDAAGDTYDGVENLLGSDHNDELSGDAGANSLFGGAGADTISGGEADYIDGGDGDDTIVFSGGAVSLVVGGNDTDTLLLTANTTAPLAGYDFEVCDISAGVNADVSTNSVSFVLLGAATLTASGYGDDTVSGSAGDDVIDAGAGDDSIDGGDGADLFWSTGGTDSFDGGAGVDTLSFEGIAYAANVDLNLHLVMNDGTGGGFNEAISNVENLIGWLQADFLRGDGADNSIEGGASGDSLQGRDGDDTLVGGTGSDTMTGGNGDDVYYVDVSGDRVTEGSGAGTGIDLVNAAVTYTLGANVENLNLIAGAGVIDGVGNGLANAITANESGNSLDGGAGDDTLDGGAGADTMAGGADDDTYVVDDIGDEVTEQDGQGVDTVRASVSFNLGDNVEDLVLTAGALALMGMGNGLDNHLTGNGNANTLVGGAGADTMTGGSGDDVYIVEDATDRVSEQAGEGRDTVRASIDYTLTAEVENLVLTGPDGLEGHGNALDNHLTGTIGDDHLFGGPGADTLAGGLGDDTYAVSDVNAVIEEADGEGYDFVRAVVSFELSDGVERLAMRGGDDTDGVGNGLDNRIGGSRADNRLDGAGGDDIIRGKGGDDTLVGGAGQDNLKGCSGADTFLFQAPEESAPDAFDRILGFQQGQDHIDLSGIDDSLGALHFGGGRHFSGEAGEVIARATAYVTYVEADLDGDAVADMTVVLKGTMELTAADLVL